MPEAGNFIKKEALAQVFPCEFCEISKSTFFAEHLWATASENSQYYDYDLYDLHSSNTYNRLFKLM